MTSTAGKFTFAALAIILASAAGCNGKSICPSIDKAVSVETVVEDYNANAAKIPRLWSYAKVAMTFRKNPGELGFTIGSTSPLASPNARLFLTKAADRLGPQDFFLQTKEAGKEIARLGVSLRDSVYYMWFNAGDRKLALTGQLVLAGAPGLAAMPLDPTQLLGVLSICELPTDLTQPPLVAQTISTDPCAYVLTYIDRQPISNKLLFKREIYFDRREGVPRQPFMVKIFDDHGRAVLTAKMKNYQPIRLEDVVDESATPPVMPTDIRLTWHKSGSELRMVLSGMTTADKVDPEAYRFYDRLPATLKGSVRRLQPKLPSRPGNAEKK
ncbi:MAG: hypothetical protein K8S55_01465 [Phycisphaerae bacterium]|nr:hypothetical protein [Phycisphaerae bacterium]